MVVVGGRSELGLARAAMMGGNPNPYMVPQTPHPHRVKWLKDFLPPALSSVSWFLQFGPTRHGTPYHRGVMFYPEPVAAGCGHVHQSKSLMAVGVPFLQGWLLGLLRTQGSVVVLAYEIFWMYEVLRILSPSAFSIW